MFASTRIFLPSSATRKRFLCRGPRIAVNRGHMVAVRNTLLILKPQGAVMTGTAGHLIRGKACHGSSPTVPVSYPAIRGNKTNPVSDMFQYLVIELQFFVEHSLTQSQYFSYKEITKAL